MAQVIISQRVMSRPAGSGWASLSVRVGMARTERVRVPNPKKAGKGRLDAKPTRAHRPKTGYRRRPKHPGRDAAD